MIDLRTKLSEREPIEVVELILYQKRLADDTITKIMEKLQGAAVELVALEDEATGPSQLRATAASKSLMESYRFLAQLMQANSDSMIGLASYLKLHEVDTFTSMKELYVAQRVFQEMDEENELQSDGEQIPDIVAG